MYDEPWVAARGTNCGNLYHAASLGRKVAYRQCPAV